MSAPASAQSYKGANPLELNAIVDGFVGIPNVEVAEGPEFPISGDETTKVAQGLGLQQIINAANEARHKAGKAQREKAHHTP